MSRVEISEAARAGVKSVSFEGAIIRADGTVEPLGVIAYWHESRWRRFAWRVGQMLRGRS